MSPHGLLVNPKFGFHFSENHRLGEGVSFVSHNVAFWNTNAWADITASSLRFSGDAPGTYDIIGE